METGKCIQGLFGGVWGYRTFSTEYNDIIVTEDYWNKIMVS